MNLIQLTLSSFAELEIPCLTALLKKLKRKGCKSSVAERLSKIICLAEVGGHAIESYTLPAVSLYFCSSFCEVDNCVFSLFRI